MPKKAVIEVKTVGSDKISFRDRNSISIEIKDVITTTKEIIDKDTKKAKTVNTLEMNVIDLSDNKSKEFSTLSSRLQNLLNDINEFEGLIDNKLSITKIGSGFGTNWKIDSLLKESKWNQVDAEARIKAIQEKEQKKKFSK